jgi:hypothetical protein
VVTADGGAHEDVQRSQAGRAVHHCDGDAEGGADVRGRARAAPSGRLARAWR